MNKTIIGIITAIFVLGGFIWVARPDSQYNVASSANVNAALTVEESDSYDFGTISMVAGKVKHQFKIRNTSDKTVAINKMYTSCMCTTALLIIGEKRFGPYGMPGHEDIPKINQTVNSNEVAEVEIVFDPAAHGPAGVGRIQRTVTIENNAGQSVLLQFAAIVTP